MISFAQYKQKAWFWCLFPALTMSLGWMLRGYIGGGPFGAMIPGAMVGLSLCLLLDRHRDAAWIAAFAAVGVGFGGQETYGQTVGLALRAEAFSWAILGFFIKGGVWGLLGGAIIGIALTRHRYANKDLIAAFALMVAGTYAGWKLVNEPRIIYFSDPINMPRDELWFGLLLGAVVMLAWLHWRAGAMLPWRFALWGALGGSIGFAFGAAVHVWGHHNAPHFPFGWWKFMEMTFGLLLGLGFGICAWRNRKEIAGQPEHRPHSQCSLLLSIACAALAIALALLLPSDLTSRIGYTIAGALLLTIALYSESFSWQLAITVTYCAFATDLLLARPTYPAAAMWTFVVITTLAVAVYARAAGVRNLFLLMIWTSTLMSMLKAFLPPAELTFPVFVMEGVFLLFAVLLTWLAIRGQARRATTSD
ncbi:MAG: hypothetical protein L0Z07_09690 [Planctomycetes bacterium]|nr:hypothetical protein [Planctomycetota bacterium]